MTKKQTKVQKHILYWYMWLIIVLMLILITGFSVQFDNRLSKLESRELPINCDLELKNYKQWLNITLNNLEMCRYIEANYCEWK